MKLKLSPPRCVISKESVQQKWIDELWFRKQLSTCLFVWTLNSWARGAAPSQCACGVLGHTVCSIGPKYIFHTVVRGTFIEWALVSYIPFSKIFLAVLYLIPVTCYLSWIFIHCLDNQDYLIFNLMMAND